MPEHILQFITEKGPESVPASRIFAVVEGARPHTCYVHLRALGPHSRPKMMVVEEDLMELELRCPFLFQDAVLA
ncbi:hypothetical protein [Deinococcus misasensis]|uniref:hypothetical protein n=1 Tax=Deinococcus misasensis TaxID=392413 RepID=UPI0005596ABA|nr:hypothetical protein [Deinococcus misasensis]